MVQIAFLTILLGLNSGSQDIELSVAGPVAVVELRLDGAAVGRLDGPPWKWRLDLGSELLPHELVARALDGEGAEIASVRQTVNLPRPQAEVAVALEESGAEGPAAVRLAWQSLIAGEPTRISLTLDGKPLAVNAEGRATLPRRDPDVPQLLSAELEFPHGITARRDVALGAEGGEAFGELTALPVRARGRLPAAERMQGWFTAAGKPLRVVAVEREPAQVIIVRDLAARPYLATLEQKMRGPLQGMTLGRDDRVRFLWPKPRVASRPGVQAELFDSSQEFTTFGLHYLLSRVIDPVDSSDGQRLADAVAVAGLQAVEGNHPRAVVLVLGPKPVETSRFDLAAIRRYLAALGVPLYVWSAVPPAAWAAAGSSIGAWGTVEDVSSRENLLKAIRRLRDDLESQHIVFLEGLHLPQSVALSPTAPAAMGLELP